MKTKTIIELIGWEQPPPNSTLHRHAVTVTENGEKFYWL